MQYPSGRTVPHDILPLVLQHRPWELTCQHFASSLWLWIDLLDRERLEIKNPKAPRLNTNSTGREGQAAKRFIFFWARGELTSTLKLSVCWDGQTKLTGVPHLDYRYSVCSPSSSCNWLVMKIRARRDWLPITSLQLERKLYTVQIKFSQPSRLKGEMVVHDSQSTKPQTKSCQTRLTSHLSNRIHHRIILWWKRVSIDSNHVYSDA